MLFVVVKIIHCYESYSVPGYPDLLNEIKRLTVKQGETLTFFRDVSVIRTMMIETKALVIEIVQSRKLVNWKGWPRSASRTNAMTS